MNLILPTLFPSLHPRRQEIPLLGNTYSLSKSLYTKVVRPIAVPLLPYATPILSKVGSLVEPLTTPCLDSVGLAELKPLTANGKGNSVILVKPEGEGVKQTIVGGKIGENQEFDWFVARVCETAKGAHKPVWGGTNGSDGGKED
jgi:hypothetical protein